jgi:cytoskeleton protein RodZ
VKWGCPWNRSTAEGRTAQKLNGNPPCTFRYMHSFEYWIRCCIITLDRKLRVELMQSIGKTLHASRLQAGLSLEEISSRTCISSKCLQAIENDDVSGVPSVFFYKSFVNQFGRELGFSPEDLAAGVAAITASLPAPLVPGQEAQLIKRALIKPLTPKRNLRWLYPAASLAVVLIGCSAFYAFWENSKADLFESVVSWVPAGLKSGGLHNSGADDSETASVSSSASAASSNSRASSQSSRGFRVELSALEPTWLSIMTDGRQTFKGILETEQKKVLEGHERGRIRMGNAGGISIVFNGKPMGVMGPRGQVRTVIFTDSDYQVLRPSVGVALTRFTLSDGLMAFQAPLHY